MMCVCACMFPKLNFLFDRLMCVWHKGNDKLFPFLRANHFPGFLADARRSPEGRVTTWRARRFGYLGLLLWRQLLCLGRNTRSFAVSAAQVVPPVLLAEN